VVLSYIDRLVLPTLKPDLQARYGWSETGYASLAIWFQAGTASPMFSSGG
jgi:ACS family hexuronate transporter-like MFS transporter